MNANEYQEWTRSVAIYPNDTEEEAVSYTVLGLVGEAGEIANKYKKVLRDDGGKISLVKIQELRDEVGDVAWYLARLADELGVTLEQLFQRNHDKLEERKSRNTLQGSGDNR